MSHILLWGRYELIRVKYDNSSPCSYCQTGSFEARSCLDIILDLLRGVRISSEGFYQDGERDSLVVCFGEPEEVSPEEGEGKGKEEGLSLSRMSNIIAV